MNKYSDSSAKNIKQCHPVLVVVFVFVLKYIDHKVTTGGRKKGPQNKLFKSGKSKVEWPLSKHNKTPSHAVDAYPWISGKISFNQGNCIEFASIVKMCSKKLGVPIRWGGDWNQDGDQSDERFRDLGHFELDVEEYKKTVWFKIYGL